VRRLIGASVVAAGLLALPSAASATPPIWESNIGAPIAGITDQDDAATTIPLGSFSFPFYGSIYTGAQTFGVSSNGLVELNPAPPGNDDNTPSGADAMTGPPKIAALWADFDPSITGTDHGQVYMNTFNDDSDPAIDRVVFTWDSQFFGCETLPTCKATAQVQLFESGKVVLGYNGVLTNQANDQCCFGSPIQPTFSAGGPPLPTTGPFPNPPGTDFSEVVPFTAGTLNFESFNGIPIHFDLDQSDLVFTPGPNGYKVTSPVDIALSVKGPKKGTRGGTAAYKAIVKNTGSVAVEGVSLTDTLPGGTKLASAKGCKHNGDVTCKLGTIQPGKGKKVTVKLRLKAKGKETSRFEAFTTTPGDGHGNNLVQKTTQVKGH
jgi:uncharacterized repeat protein (TIGR01451 family)